MRGSGSLKEVILIKAAAVHVTESNFTVLSIAPDLPPKRHCLHDGPKEII